jgi:hypothetical protein
LELRALSFADRDPRRLATVRPDLDVDLAFEPFLTDRAAAFFPLGLPLVGSTVASAKVRVKARKVDSALSLGSDTTIIELPSYM